MSIEQEIDSLIQNSGGNYREWYVGLAINPRQELFDVHHVSEKSGTWAYKDARSETAARNIEAVFLKKGCQGGTVKKDSSRHVYIYKMKRGGSNAKF
jgi:hypothetical protein